jgi:hypothetical protein
MTIDMPALSITMFATKVCVGQDEVAKQSPSKDNNKGRVYYECPSV